MCFYPSFIDFSLNTEMMACFKTIIEIFKRNLRFKKIIKINFKYCLFIIYFFIETYIYTERLINKADIID